MLTRSKKIFLSLLLTVFLFVNLSAPLAYAEEPWYTPGFFNDDGFYAKVNDPANPTEIFGERYTTAQVHWIVYGVVGQKFSDGP